MKRRPGFLVVVVMISLAGTVLGQETVPSSDYFPLKIGTTWHYRGGGKTFIAKVTRHEKIGDVPCARLEMTLAGKVIATEHVAVRNDGVYLCSLSGKAITPALRILKLPLKKGDTWKAAYQSDNKNISYEYTGGEETVKVPAGKFPALVAKATEREDDKQRAQTSIWYARGVGMVKTVIIIKDQTFVLELEKFEPVK